MSNGSYLVMTYCIRSHLSPKQQSSKLAVLARLLLELVTSCHNQAFVVVSISIFIEGNWLKDGLNWGDIKSRQSGLWAQFSSLI
jgi:hypothetical protein